jgi:hypothetical protein
MPATTLAGLGAGGRGLSLDDALACMCQDPLGRFWP